MKSLFDTVINTIRSSKGKEAEALRNALRLEEKAIYFDRPYFRSQEEDRYFDTSYNPNPRDTSIAENVLMPDKNVEDVNKDELKINKVGKVRQYSKRELNRLARIDPFAQKIASLELDVNKTIDDPDIKGINPFIARSILDAEGYNPYRESNGRISIYGIGNNKNQKPKQSLEYAYNVFKREYIDTDPNVKQAIESAPPEDQYAMAQFILHKPAIFKAFLKKRMEQDKPLSGDDFIEDMFDYQRNYYITGNRRANDPEYKGERFVKTFDGVMARVNNAEETWRKLRQQRKER